MGFLDNRCEMGHTPLCPGKEETRANWIYELQSNKRKPQGIITVSHAALGSLSTLRHTGFIQVVDKDKGSCVTAEHAARKYTRLNIRKPMNMPLDRAVYFHIDDNSIHDVGIIDADFTSGILGAVEENLAMIKELSRIQWAGKFLLTFVNHRDQFGDDGTSKRLSFLRHHLPTSMRRSVKHHTYSSDYFGRWGEYHKGSAMCMVEIQRAA